MRSTLQLIVLIVLAATAVVLAQTENIDPPNDGPTTVLVAQPPATKLDAIDQRPGLVVKGLTQVGDVPDDRGGDLTVYAVTADDHSGSVLRGLALVVTQPGNRVARAYVDDDEIAPLIDAVQTLIKLDRNATPLDDFRGIYRTKGNVAVLNVDDHGARIAIVRTLQVSPLTGQVTWAAARYRVTRLNEILRQLQLAKEALDKATK